MARYAFVVKIVAGVGSLSQAAHAFQVARLQRASHLTLVAHETTTITGVVTEFFDRNGPLKDFSSIRVEIITAKTTFDFWRHFLQPSDLALYCDDRGAVSLVFNLGRLLFRKKFALLEDGELAYNWRQVAEFEPPRSKIRTVIASLLRLNYAYGSNWSSTKIYVTDPQEFLDNQSPALLTEIRARVIPLPNVLHLLEELGDPASSFIRDQISALSEEVHQVLQDDGLSVYFDGGHPSLSPWSNLKSTENLVVFPHPNMRNVGQYPTDCVVSDRSVPAELVIFHLLSTCVSFRVYVVRSSLMRYLNQFLKGSNVSARISVHDLITDDLEEQYFSKLHFLHGKGGLVSETSFTEGDEQ